LIREIKNSYSMAKVPTRRLMANRVYLELLLWAYALVSIFKHLCLPPLCQNWTLHTLQRELWILPAQLVKKENRYCLNFPSRFLNQDLFQYVCRRISQISLIS
ncbi:MAG: transposase, partial [Candidatus Omnitrophota bacterium]